MTNIQMFTCLFAYLFIYLFIQNADEIQRKFFRIDTEERMQNFRTVKH
jgi:hypothetical protein